MVARWAFRLASDVPKGSYIVFFFCEMIALVCLFVGIEHRWADGQVLAGWGWNISGVAVGLVGISSPNLIGAIARRFTTWRRRGRRGLLNVRVDVPKAIAAQDRRLFAIAELVGRLVEALEDGAKAKPTTEQQRIELATRTAAAIRPIARELRREADRFRAETGRLSSWLDRWMEIAEPDQANNGVFEQQQMPNLVRMLSSGAAVLPTLREKRQVFERLREASDTMDASCGAVVDAFDVVISATEQTVATAERSLRRIKVILERYVARSQTPHAAADSAPASDSQAAPPAAVREDPIDSVSFTFGGLDPISWTV
jgi:hypothetical protein